MPAPQARITPAAIVVSRATPASGNRCAGYSDTGRHDLSMSTALELVATAADDVAADQRRVARRARAMQRLRDRGWSWAKVLDREAEPGLLELLRSSARRLWCRSASWRRRSLGGSTERASHGDRSPGASASPISASRPCCTRIGHWRRTRTPRATGRQVDLEFAVCLPRTQRRCGLVRRVVANALICFGVTPGCVDDIRLALSEALANVIEHPRPIMSTRCVS